MSAPGSRARRRLAAALPALLAVVLLTACEVHVSIKADCRENPRAVAGTDVARSRGPTFQATEELRPPPC